MKDIFVVLVLQVILSLAEGELALEPSDVAIVEEGSGFVEVCAVINSATLERDVVARIRTLPTTPLTAIGILSESLVNAYFVSVVAYLHKEVTLG